MSTSSIRSFGLLALALVAAAVGPSSLLGQAASEAGTGMPAVEAVSASAAALFAPGAALVSLVPVAPLDVVLPQDRVRAGPNIAMMAVGGAALVVGLIIGGDGGLIIATTGGVIGLVGLYRYLK